MTDEAIYSQGHLVSRDHLHEPDGNTRIVFDRVSMTATAFWTCRFCGEERTSDAEVTPIAEE